MNFGHRLHNYCKPLFIQKYLRFVQKNTRYSMGSNQIGQVQLEIQKKLQESFAPTVLQVVNESYKHAVPSGSETHFKVLVVSEAFKGKPAIQRHRSVNTVLEKELSGPVHALSIQAKTPEQWEKSDQVIGDTPPCLGGSKHKK
uniref:BolA-like protein 1 n=1 Tax=Phallusia mammillata TaxID=59560 RepID=A0A6F9D766_9ASCI|nr:bolA-like protein 1 [Phallusia mammillata]